MIIECGANTPPPKTHLLRLQLVPQGLGVDNLRHVHKVHGVGDAQLPHALRVPPLCKVLRKGLKERGEMSP